MKKYILVIVTLIYSFLAVNMPFAYADSWTAKADFGGGQSQATVSFSIGSKGYMGTGRSASPFTSDFWEYDPVADTWTQKADFGGTARYNAVGFSIESKGYMGTGFDSGYLYTSDFWEYDPIANTWTQKADFGGGGREAAVGFSIGSKGYMGTGLSGSTFTSDFWEYDPIADAWTQMADFGGTGRWNAVGFSIGSKGYIGTGSQVRDASTREKDFWEYDPIADTWTQMADFGGGVRFGAVGFSIGSKGYMGAGDNASTFKNDFWGYDPVTNTWTQMADFGGTGRDEAVGFSIGSKGYIGTGFDGSSLTSDFWEYDPCDTTPEAFTFFGQTSVGLSQTITSNTITVNGITCASAISITGGTYAINSGSYTSASGTVNNDDTVTVQQTSSGSFSKTTDAALTIGGVTGTFSVTTQAAPPGSGCYIATAAFGSPLERHVQILRDFRDRILLKSSIGKAVVQFYYRTSPAIADKIAQSEGLRFITRVVLVPVIGVVYLMIHMGILMTIIFFTIIVLTLIFAIRTLRKRIRNSARA